MRTPGEDKLIERHRGGDPQAFEQIVRQHWADVIALATRWLGSEGAEGAEDIAVEVFVALHGELARWRGEASLRTWLYRATFRKCGNLIQERERRRRASQRLGRGRPAGAGEAPDEAAQRQEQSRRLAGALDSLPWRERAVIVLFHYQQLSLKQIADVLGLSPSTAKRVLRKSLDMLKRILSTDKQL